MATISVILGGILGFFSAMTGLLVFKLTALQALSVWSGTGILTLLALVLLAHRLRPRAAPDALKSLAKWQVWLHIGAAKS